MQTFIAVLADYGALSAPIIWRTTSIAEARELLVNVGAWQSSPDDSGDMLLSDGASVVIYDDAPPFRKDDDLAARIEGASPRITFDIGPRGGIRRHA